MAAEAVDASAASVGEPEREWTPRRHSKREKREASLAIIRERAGRCLDHETREVMLPIDELVRIVLDMTFDSAMRQSEINSLVSQVDSCYHSTLQDDEPVDMCVTGIHFILMSSLINKFDCYDDVNNILPARHGLIASPATSVACQTRRSRSSSASKVHKQTFSIITVSAQPSQTIRPGRCSMAWTWPLASRAPIQVPPSAVLTTHSHHIPHRPRHLPVTRCRYAPRHRAATRHVHHRRDR